MKYLIQIGIYIVGLVVIILLLSLVPFSFIPQKILYKTNIKPITISEYGYINLFSRQYFVNNFAYISKYTDDAYVILRSNKIGVSMFGGKNTTLNGCELYIITSKKQSEILDIFHADLNDNSSDISILGKDCTIDIHQIDSEQILELGKKDAVNDEDIINIFAKNQLHIENVDFNIYKNLFARQYAISGNFDNHDMVINFSQNEAGVKADATLDTTTITYNKRNNLEIFQLKSPDFATFVREGLCTSAFCKNTISNLFNGNAEITLQTDTNNLETPVISGNISGIVNGNIAMQDGEMVFSAKDINLNYPSTEPQKTTSSNRISFTNLFKKYFQTPYNIKVLTEKISINNHDIFTNLTGHYNKGDNTLQISGKSSNNGEVTTSKTDGNNQVFEVSNLNLQSLTGFISPEILSKNLLLNNSNNVLGRLVITIANENEIHYPSEIKYTISEGKFIEYTANSCSANCDEHLLINGVNIAEIIDINALIKIWNIPQFIANSGEIKQSALMYTSGDEFATDNKANTAKITIKNCKFNNHTLNAGEMIYANSAKNRALSLQNFDSDLLSGNMVANITFTTNTASNIDISGKVERVKFQEILGILYPNSKIQELMLVPPSLAGFNGKINLTIGDTGTDYHDIAVNGKIDNGMLSFSDASLMYKENKIKVNGNISLISKTIANLGIGINSLNLRDMFKSHGDFPLNGVLNLAGTVNFSGFSGQEYLKSLSGNFNGKIYRYTVNSCNLQKLSDTLFNFKAMKTANIDAIVQSGSITFDEAMLNLSINQSKVTANFANAKQTAVSGSGSCTLDFSNDNIERCTAIFVVIGRDVVEQDKFSPLQISWAGGGNVRNMQYAYNLEQVKQYRDNVLKIPKYT